MKAEILRECGKSYLLNVNFAIVTHICINNCKNYSLETWYTGIYGVPVTMDSLSLYNALLSGFLIIFLLRDLYFKHLLE
jgi:hypothetical protein